jgi:hypothetical protein
MNISTFMRISFRPQHMVLNQSNNIPSLVASHVFLPPPPQQRPSLNTNQVLLVVSILKREWMSQILRMMILSFPAQPHNEETYVPHSSLPHSHGTQLSGR